MMHKSLLVADFNSQLTWDKH